MLGELEKVVDILFRNFFLNGYFCIVFLCRYKWLSSCCINLNSIVLFLVCFFFGIYKKLLREENGVVWFFDVVLGYFVDVCRFRVFCI